MHEKYQECIQECLHCMQICNHCYDACLKEENVKMMADCIRLDRECADICGFAAKAMASNSPFAPEICQLCASICEACGNECKNITQHTVKNAPKFALNVQNYAEKWLVKKSSKRQWSIV